MHITVIGAGPAGNHTAYHLAMRGHQVDVFERNPVIGPPVQCTGILSDYFTTIMSPSKEFVQNVVTRTRIYAPNGTFVDTRIKKNYVVCRKKFDTFLANQAIKKGVKYHMQHSFQGYDFDGKKLKIHLKHNSQDFTVTTDRLVGADGPLSSVATAAGLLNNRVSIIGSQIEAKMDHQNIVDFFPYIGCYAWIVPVEKNSVRIGVAAYKDAMKHFKLLVKQHIGIDYKAKTLENQSGVIPIFQPQQPIQKENVYLIGDAAGMVKATTGGGINQSLKAAKVLAECIDENKNYQSEIKRKLYKNLCAHRIIHNLMQRFTIEDWNYLIESFSKDPLKSILRTKSRDKIIPMMFAIALKRPGMIRYAKYVKSTDLRILMGML